MPGQRNNSASKRKAEREKERERGSEKRGKGREEEPERKEEERFPFFSSSLLSSRRDLGFPFFPFSDLDFFRRSRFPRAKRQVVTKMENCPARLSSFGQLFPGCVSDEKSRYCQNGSPSLAGAEVICPEPRRATRVPCIVDSLSRLNPKSKSIFPVHKGNNGLEILNAILGKDDLEGDADPGNLVGFFWGSPPVRTNNPMVHDAQFTKQTLPSASPLGSSYGATPPRLERGSPSCGSPLGANPKVRVEGFSCGSPKSRIVPALA